MILLTTDFCGPQRRWNRNCLIRGLHGLLTTDSGAAPKRASGEVENGPENGPEPKTTDERQIQIYQPHRSLRELQVHGKVSFSHHLFQVTVA
jgi:hypothetical protein